MNNFYRTYKKWLAGLSLAAVLVINYIVSAFRINGTTTGEVSDFYPNLFAPIGLTFAIWGLIYGALIIYVIRQLGFWSDKKDAAKEVVDKITTPFIISSLLNIAWIMAWQYRVIWLSLLLIILLLVTLIRINSILRLKKLSPKDAWLIKFPFAIYFGWLTVATIANTVVWLVSINWDGFGISAQLWTILVMLIGAVIGIMAAIRLNSLAYILVFAWAYLGIFLKHTSVDYYDYSYPSVVLCSGALVGVYVLVAGLIAYRQRR